MASLFFFTGIILAKVRADFPSWDACHEMWQGNPAYDAQVFNAAPGVDRSSNFLSKLDQQGDTNATASPSNNQDMVVEGPDSGPSLEQPIAEGSHFHQPDVPMDGAEEEEEGEEEDMYGRAAEEEEFGGGDQQMGPLPVNSSVDQQALGQACPASVCFYIILNHD